MDKNLFDKQMEKLGIYELRSLARSVGVKSPTTKKREELLKLISDIMAGKTTPLYNNRFGRPVKNLSNQDELMSNLLIFGDKELEDKIKKVEIKDHYDLLFKQELSKEDEPLNYNLIEVKGIIRKTEKGSYYALNCLKISVKTYVLIEEKFINENNLIEGDLIEGTAYLSPNKNYAKLNLIQKINGEDKQKNVYDLEKEVIIPQKSLENNFLQGRCKVEVVKDLDASINYIKEKTKVYSLKNCVFVVLGLEISIETKLKLDQIENITEIVSLIEDKSYFSYEKILDTINHVNSLFYHNKNVVMFALDTMSLYRVLDVVFKSSNNIHDERVKYTIRKLLGCAKASQSSSISNIMLFYDYQKTNYLNEYNDLVTLCNSWKFIIGNLLIAHLKSHHVRWLLTTKYKHEEFKIFQKDLRFFAYLASLLKFFLYLHPI